MDNLQTINTRIINKETGDTIFQQWIYVENIFYLYNKWNDKVDNLGKRSKAVGGTTCIRDDIHARVVILLIYSNHKHGSISGRSRYDHFLCTPLFK